MGYKDILVLWSYYYFVNENWYRESFF